ncbi:MAG: hypothetical protein DI582_06545 [Azospirillum brasilense]|nr:MAG: hypothetical protein DI582_06545 [Azospirillum brasilense]
MQPNPEPTIEATPTAPGVFHYLARGWRQRCPACGQGRLFGKYLKVNADCAHCAEDLHHHRADDFPAYIVIILLGHILVPLVVEAELRYAPAMWVHAVIWLPLACLLTWYLLPRVKGAVVAYQWYKGMHGFFHARQKRLAGE